jgi:hypothetical protein
MTSDKASSLSERKKRRVKQADDLANTESLRRSLVERLDSLYQAQLNHRKRNTTIVATIENENRRLLAESREFQDSQIYRLLKKTHEDQGNQTRKFIADLVEDMLAQQRRLFEKGFVETEQLARTLVAHLEESMWAQQCRVLGMKQFIL